MIIADLCDLPADEWLLHSFRYFRDLGFFAEFQGIDDEAACVSILEKRGRPFNPRSPLADLRLLSYDPTAFWRDSMENCGRKPGFYAEALRGWSPIARGTFDLADIVEDFGRDTGKPTLVWFRFEGKRHVVFADHRPRSQWDDWLDLTLIDQLNIILEHKPRQYCLFKQPFNDACLFCLTDLEREVLKLERGWRFHFDDDDDEEDDAYMRRFGIGGPQKK